MFNGIIIDFICIIIIISLVIKPKKLRAWVVQTTMIIKK